MRLKDTCGPVLHRMDGIRPLLRTNDKRPPCIMCHVLGMLGVVLWFDLGTVLFLKNPKIRQTSSCAGSLAGAPIHTHFRNSKTKSLLKDIEVLYSTSFTATGISMLQMYSQTAVRLRLARSLRCCSAKP